MAKARRKATDAMIGVSSVCSVLAGLSVFSVEVRAWIANLLAGDPAGEVSTMAFRAQGFGHEVVRSLNVYRAENGPMVAFGVVAVLLALLMFKM